jgi:hypothetical protein
VISFGCGPGSDLLGFQQFYEQKKKQRITELLRRRQAQSTQGKPRQRQGSSVDDTKTMIQEIMNAKVSYTGYDSSSGWSEYIDRLGYNFCKQHIDRHFVDGMQSVDVAILCYFSHSANLHQPSRSGNL